MVIDDVARAGKVAKAVKTAKAASEAAQVIVEFRGTRYAFPPGTDKAAAERVLWNKVVRPQATKQEEVIELPSELPKERLDALEPKQKWLVIHGGRDFDKYNPAFWNTGERGGLTPLGKGLYGYVVKDPKEAESALYFARRYAANAESDPSKQRIHAFEIEVGRGDVLMMGRSFDESLHDADKASKFDSIRNRDAWPVETTRLPIDLTEVSVKNPDMLIPKNKWSTSVSDEEILKDLGFPVPAKKPKKLDPGIYLDEDTGKYFKIDKDGSMTELEADEAP